MTLGEGGTWRLRELAREATSWSGPRQVLLVAFVIVVLTGVGLVTSLFAHRSLDQEAERRDAGGLVWEALGPEGAPLDAGACDGLMRADGVSAAGGVLVGEQRGFVLFEGGRPLPTVQVTPGTVQAWSDQPVPTGILLGADLQALELVEVGSPLLDPAGALRTTVAGRVPSAVPASVLRSSLVVRSAAIGQVTTCWARMDPGAFEMGSDVMGAAFAGSGALIRPYLRTDFGPSPAQRWREYTGLAPWAGGGLVISLAAAFVAWGRRSELAIYRTFGMSRIQTWLLLAIESISLLMIGTSASFVLTIAGTALLRGDTLGGDVVGVAGGQVLAAALAATAIAPGCSILLLRGGVVDQLKDR